MDATEPGRLLSGRYRLITVIGRGGMGVVWRGHDELLNRDVAVKEVLLPLHLSEDDQQLWCRRATREAQMAGRLSHRNIVRIFDIVEEDGHPSIVMEYLPYRSLRELVAEDGPLSPAQAAEVGLGVLAALRAAHDEGILHRDVKPANILVGAEGRVVLTDFGIARAADSPTLTGTGMLLGSPAYMAPERARGGKADSATATGDLWGLGASLYAAVEGHPPFDRGNALATLTAVVVDDPAEPAHAGPLEPVIMGLLRKEPAERMDADEAEYLMRRVLAADAPPAGPAAPEPAETTGEDADAAPEEAVPEAVVPDPVMSEPARGPQSGSGPELTGLPELKTELSTARLPAAATAPHAEALAPPTAVAEPGAPARDTSSATETPSKPGLPVVPGAPSESQGRPRRSRGPLVLLAALVVVAAGVTGVALYLTSSSGQPASAAGSPRPTASRSTSAAPGTAAPSTAVSPSTPTSPKTSPATAPSTTTAPASPATSASGGSGALPAGYYRFTNSTGFSIGVPDGWKISHQGHYVYIIDPANAGIYLLIDQSDNPKSDPLADWQQQEANREGTYQDYRRIRLTSVSYPQAEKAADWEFTYVKSGVLLHVLNRNVLANAKHAYALYWATPESDWSTDYHYFQAFAGTFRPAGA